MEATSLDGKQPEISYVEYRSQGAMAPKHLVIAIDSMGRKPTSRKILFILDNLGR